MKKIITLCVCMVFIVTFFMREESRKIIFNPSIDKNIVKNTLSNEAQLKIVRNSSESAPTVLDFEREYFKNSNEEIRLAIEKNNRVAREMNFIALANSNKLDEVTTVAFLKYIHLNSALHKILLERQLDEIEMENI